MNLPLPFPRFPRARSSDASSSHAAAAHLEATGLDRLQSEQVLAALKRYDNCTSHELAKASGLDRYAIGRRMSELAAQDLVDRIKPTKDTVPCAVSGKRVVRWRVR